MKPKVSAIFPVVCLVACFLAADGFCTTAKRTLDGKRVRHISEDVYPSEATSVPSANKYSARAAKDESDCYNLIPDPEVPAVTEHDMVGPTWYEFQKNGSMGRMISVTSAGTGGYRHVSWMWTAGVYPGNQRRVYARSKPAAGAWSTAQEVGLGTVNSGYSNQTHFHDGTSVVIFHRTGIGGNWSYLALADGPAAEPLYARKWDLPDLMPEATSGEDGAWPKCEVLYCVDAEVHPDPLDFIHIVETEGNLASGYERWIGYLRCYVDPLDVMNLKCQTPTTGGEVYNIPANTPFVDEVYGFGSSCDISAVVVTGRGIVGRRVAIPYMPPAVPGDCDYLSDVAYVECMDNADGWLDGTDWWPTVHYITNFGTTGKERAFHDLSACYDYQDSLHIVWVTVGFDPANPGFYQPGVARLYHWSKENGISLIANKIQEGANPSAHNVNLSKPSISAKDPIYHPGGDSIYLFCIWTQVDSSDQNAAGDQGNQDLFGSGSFDGGRMWGKPLNLTGTHTPGCNPGACVSEHWPSMAENMFDGDLHIEYICDRDAGAAVMDEGAWTENYVMYMRLPEWETPPTPLVSHRIDDPPHWYHPPMKVLPNQNRAITFKVFSVGTEDLIYSVTSDHPCLQVSVPSTPLPPGDSAEISILVDGTGACDGTFVAGNVILTTNEAGGRIDNLRVHAVVSDEYYECPRDPETVDTLENGYLRMYVNANCQQWIHDIGYRPDTTFEVFFRGGTIVATTQGSDTLVGRFMGENDMRAGAQDKLYKVQCEPDWEPHFWILYTKEVYIEASHLAPPAHLKWWWWEISKQIKFFKETAPEVYKHLVIKYVSVKRKDHPGWWPDWIPFTNYEDTYIGFAMDLDCPADTIGGQYASNYVGYDAANEIAWQRGFDYTGAHPQYNDYYCGIALADAGVPGEQIVPYGSFNVRNDQYLYPQDGWGWLDGELYQLASAAGNNIQDPGAAVDRSQVLIARKIDAGTNPDEKAAFTVVEVVAPNGLAQLQEYVDSARAIVEREKILGGLPVVCGDVDGDGDVDVDDIEFLAEWYTHSGPPPPCPTSRADVNGDGIVNVGDIVYLVTFVYKNGPEPSCPGIDFPSYAVVTPPRDVEAISDTLGVYLSWRNSQYYDVLYLYEQTDEIVLLDFFTPGTDSTYSYVPDAPGTYCYFLRGEKDGDFSGYSQPACASYGPDPWQVPSVITWSDSGFAPQDTPVVHPEWYWHVEGKDPTKATGWQFGTPVHWPIGNPTGWGTNLPDPYYENSVCTPPLASANIFVPAVQPPGDTRIIIRHWYRTAYNDLDDRCFVAAQKYGIPASEAYLYTDPADAVWGAHPYAAGTGNNACGANVPGFCGEGLRVVSAFHMPTSFNGNWVQIKFYLGSDGSDNQGQYGQNTHWFLDQVAAIGTGIHRGDCNGDNIVDVGDVVYLTNYLYRGGPPPMPLEQNDSTGDVNLNGIADVGDVVYLTNFLYRGGSPPPPP